MGEFFDKAKHVLTKTCSKAMSWGVTAALVGGGLALLTLPLSGPAAAALTVANWIGLTSLSVTSIATTVIGGAAAIGGALGLIDGVATTGQVEDRNMEVAVRSAAVQNNERLVAAKIEPMRSGGYNPSMSVASQSLPSMGQGMALGHA